MSARLSSVAACGLLFSGCLAPIQHVVNDVRWGLQRDVDRALAPFGEGQVRLLRCGAIRGETVAFPEEKTLGDAMGVKVAAAKGGLALNWTESKGAVMLASPDVANDRARAVAVVGAGVARHSGRPEIPWRFGVLASDEVNAVSAPGGLVFITRGALAKVQSEDQLAGILAHEVAHVALRHALDRYATEKRNACYGELVSSKLVPRVEAPDVTPEGLEGARRLFGEDVARSLSSGLDLDLDDGRRRGLLDALSSRAVEGLYAQGMDRPAEVAADALAVDLLLAAGYQPEEFIRFVGTLPDNGNFFSHHPSPQDRVDEMMGHLERRRAEEDPLRPTPRAAPVPLPPALARTGN